jgi:hypothetical protein
MEVISDPNATKRKYFIAMVNKYAKPGAGSGIEFLNQRTWTHPVANIAQIIKQTQFVIVGGVATRLYMPERMTLDLDILVKAEEARLVYQDLIEANSQKIGELTIPGSQWQLEDGTLLDVLEGKDDWVHTAIQHPNSSPDGLPIIRLPYLVLMKLLAGRSQDLADISRMLGGATEVQLINVKQVIGQYLPSVLEDIESLIVLGKLENNR